MKKYTITLIILLLMSAYTMAQESNDKRYDREKLETARVAYITTRLDLTPTQAEKFWPIYNEYSDKRYQQLKEISKLNKNIEPDLSETEAKSRINKRFNIQRTMIVEEEEFVKALEGVITYKQILQLNELNREFARHIFQRQRKEH